MKSDFPLLRFRLKNQLPDGVEHHLELLVILLFQRIDFASDALNGQRHSAQSDESPDNGHAHLNSL